MALLKFRCKECGKVFDELVSNAATQVRCPQCQSAEVERAYEGKCSFGASGKGSGCSGSCSGCHGCH